MANQIDPFGAVGTAIGLIQTTVQLVNIEREKWSCYRDLPNILEKCLPEFVVCDDQLKDLRSSYDSIGDDCSEELKRSYDRLITSELEKFKEINDDLESLQTIIPKSDISGTREYVRSIRNNRKVVSRAKEITKKITEYADDLKKMVRYCHSLMGSLEEKRADQFKPYDHKSNIGSVILTMDDVMTPEGKLKRGVLTGRDGTAVLGSSPGNDLSSSGRDGTTSVEGLGGIGKTTALEGLANDEDVKKRFSDGVYFMKFGKEADERTLKENFCMIVRKSGGTKLSEKIKNISVQEIIDETIKWFTNKKVLFICDDLWPTSSNTLGVLTEIKQLGKCSSECHIVLSTRYGQIASHAWMNSGIVVKFTALEATGKRSRDVFIKNAILSDAEIEHLALDKFTSIQEILKKCDGIYLALAVAGGLLWYYKMERSLGKAVEKLDSMLMSRMESLLDEDKVRKNSTLYCCFNESLECVNDCADKVGHGMFWSTTIPRLCVFKKGTLMTWEMMNVLWSAESDEENISYVVKKLEEFHLIDSVNNGEAYKFHDLFHDFCIRKTGGERELPKLHREFLDNVSKRSGVAHMGQSSTQRKCVRSWWNLKDVGGIEEYMHSNLARHLKEAEKVDELEALMSRFEWTLHRFKKHDYNEMMNDLSIWLSEEEKKLKDANEERSKYIKKRQMRQAISSAWSKSDNDKELACEILSHLLDSRGESDDIESYISSVENLGMKGWLRPLQQIWEVPSADVINLQFWIKDISVNWMRDQAIVVLWEGQIALLNLSTLSVRVLLNNISRNVTCVAWSKSGNTVILGSEGEIMKCNVDEESTQTICNVVGNVRSVDISDGGNRVAYAVDNTIRVLDIEKGEELCVLEGDELQRKRYAISGDGSRVVSSSEDRTVCVWDVEKAKEICVFRGHSDFVLGVAISGDGSRVASSSEDRTVRVWDAEKGDELWVIADVKDCVSSVAISRDGFRVVCGSYHGRVGVWDIEKRSKLCVFQGHVETVTSVALSEDKSRVMSGLDGTVCVWKMENVVELRVVEGYDATVLSVAISGDGHRVVCGCVGRTVRVFENEKIEPLCVLDGQEDVVLDVAISGEGSRVVSGSYDKNVRVWEVEKGMKMCVLEGHEDSVSSVSISEDGNRVVSGSRDKTVRVWGLEKGAELCVLEGHKNSVLCVAMSTDGSRVVSGSKDKTIRVWDTIKGSVLCVLEGHKDMVELIAISGDGSRVMSGSGDGTVRVWNVESREQLTVLECVIGLQCRGSMSENGRIVACQSSNGQLFIWKVKDNQEGNETNYVLFWRLCFRERCDVGFIGQRIVIGFGDGRILQYDMIE